MYLLDDREHDGGAGVPVWITWRSHSLFKGLFVAAFMSVGNDQSMGLWRRAVAPAIAALAVIFLGGASSVRH